MLMKRLILASVLFFLAVEIVLAAPVLAFTPFGTRLLHDLVPPPSPSPTPILTVRGTPPAMSSQAAYLLDAETGHVLVDVQGERRLPMASTTKIMTAIADAVAGTTSKFVQTMNLFARRLHLIQTHYINPDGLTYLTPQGKPDPNQYTTTADLAHLARSAMANPFFAQLVELQHYVLPASAVHHAYTWDSINTLLSTYPGASGIKTGFTVEAGYCLVFAATNGGHHLLGALLHEPDANQRFADARALLDWGFALPLEPPAS
ncbi:MAG: D-alanyl-D-alanine carboxypeptidase [Chloroflexi bacterium]|nr:MAG: D-alanyl-D-alanine carboxypeptidase [Chloroflexota bacterium]